MHNEYWRRFSVTRATQLAFLGTLAAACAPATKDDAKPESTAAKPVAAPKTASTTDSTIGRRAPEDWVGWHYVDLPAGAQSIGGDTLTVRDTVYNTEFFQLRGQHLLWLAQGQGKGDSGAAEWTVLASMRLEPETGENLFTGACRVDKKRDPAIVALGFHEDLPVFIHIRRAWRINVTSRAFDEIPVAGIDCLNLDTKE